VFLVGDGSVADGSTRVWFKHAPVSQISGALADQGLIDCVLQQFEERFAAGQPLTVDQLSEMNRSMTHSLYFTPPEPTLASDPSTALSSLYRALVQPAYGGSSGVLTKGKALDAVVARLRTDGIKVQRGQYVGDFLFDAEVEGTGSTPVLDVLSFATTAKRWAPMEYDAGHFLYALGRVARPGLAVVVPPTAASHRSARMSHERVLRWFDKEGCPVVAPEDVVIETKKLILDSMSF